jgi:dolichol kinase
MNYQQTACLETKGVKFQRLLSGILLFLAYGFQHIPLVMFVAMIMLVTCVCGPTPFYRLCGRVLNRISQDSEASETCCTDNRSSYRFSCGIGLAFLVTSLGLFYLGQGSIAWAMVLIVASLSTVAGTVGFCLGNAVYVLLFERKEGQ